MARDRGMSAGTAGDARARDAGTADRRTTDRAPRSDRRTRRHVMSHIAGATQYDIAVPSGPHSFTVHGLIVDTVTGKTMNVGHARRVRRPSAHPPRRRWTRALARAVDGRAFGPPAGRRDSSDRVVAAHEVSSKRTTTSAAHRCGPRGSRATGCTSRRHRVLGDVRAAGEHSLIGSALADGKERFRSDLASGAIRSSEIVNKLGGRQRRAASRDPDLRSRRASARQLSEASDG